MGEIITPCRADCFFNIQTNKFKYMITKKTTNKTALGRLTVHMKNGDKSTESVDCSRSNAVRTYSDILAINGMEAELVRVLFNGRQIFPEELSTKELSNFLPEKPSPNTIKGWISKRTIPFHKAGKAKNSPVFFLIPEIQNWLDNGRAI